MKAQTNPLKDAFLAPANLMALTTAGIAAAVTENGLPALIALGVEALYLLVLSTTPSLRRALRAGSLTRADPQREAAALLEELAPSQKEHYFALQALRDRILANHRKLPGGRVLAASSEARLDALLLSFLRLIASLNHYRKHLNPADRAKVEAEIAELEAELEKDSSERIREVKNKRIEILKKRLMRFTQAEESRELVSHQLAGIEDLLKLTHEQSIAIRDPASASAQLELLTAEAQATEESVREMERFLDFEEVTGPHLMPGARVR